MTPKGKKSPKISKKKPVTEEFSDITESSKPLDPTSNEIKSAAYNESSLKDKSKISDKVQTNPEMSSESSRAGQRDPGGFFSRLKARILTYITSHQSGRPSIRSISGRQSKTRHKQRPASPPKPQTMPEHYH